MNAILVATMFLAQNPSADNAVPNPSFEEGGQEPAGWETHVWNGEGEFVYADIGHTGSRSVMIASDRGGDLTWQRHVAVKPFSTYRLSGWVKTKKVKAGSGEGALFNIHGLRPVHTPPITGTKDWTRVEVTFDTNDLDSVQVNCLFGGWGTSTGKAWFDDVQLELISTMTLEPKAVVKANETGPPISEYIYGQFIEHLGRCIYGGIWSEMIEDRKFFYDVKAEESPWGVAGSSGGSVSMTTEEPFVGEWSPLLESGGEGESYAIVSAPVELVPGRTYEGYVWLKGEGQARVGMGDEEHNVLVIDANLDPNKFVKTTFEVVNGFPYFKSGLAINAVGKSRVVVGTVSLMPADNVHGMRADTLALLKQLDSPIYRWPGGNFVSGYDWRDGIGDRDKRPPRKNPAWKGVDSNDFGIDDFMLYCKEIGTEPLVVVNTGAGEVDMALEELEYVNGAADTPMGKVRARNGHPEPYNVTWWGIGNEMYGNWQIGHMPLEDYVKKHNAFVDAMRAQSPDIKVVAVGASGKWTETMLTESADHMDALSEHFYCGEQPGLLAHVRQIPQSVRRKAYHHRKYHETIAALQGKSIPIALDEWNYWYGDHVYGELGTRYYLKDALGIAEGIHEMTRHSDVFYMANYAQTVNVIGCIKTTDTAAEFAATGLPLMLYRKHYGVIPIKVDGDTGPLDVAAAWTADKKAITLAVVNPMDDDMVLDLSFEGVEVKGCNGGWMITGNDPMAYNEPGKPRNVNVHDFHMSGFKPGGPLPLQPLSATLFELKVE
ncbi:MAG: alpha-L-arabinofuranosidase [bacterium]|nr:alpha-L-arabinofuranosidase [bacterium]